MSKYNKFEDFMQTVINEADNKCQCRYSKSLTDAYSVMKMIGFMKMIGMVAVGTFAVVGATALRTLYRDRVLPIAIKETGQKYKELFNNHINERSYIDSLLEQAADYLLSKATKLL